LAPASAQVRPSQPAGGAPASSSEPSPTTRILQANEDIATQYSTKKGRMPADETAPSQARGSGVQASPIANGRAIELPVSHGRVLLLDAPVESIFMADASIAEVNVIAPDVIYVYGKKSGTTNLIALSADRRIQATVQFRVVADARPPNEAARELQPTSTARITLFGSRPAAIGSTRTIEEAVDVDNAARTYAPPGQPPINNNTIKGSQQINIRVRFAEVSRNELQALGFDWKVLANFGNLGSGSSVNIDVVIQALQRNGMLTILAEPNLTAMTGESASFLAGGEIPVPVPQGAIGQTTIQFKPFGISLEFTPTLIRTNRIALRIRPEVSALSRIGAVKIGGFDIPGFSVRRADTTVEAASGQTFAIAGLFQRQLSQDLDQIAGLGDIPVLGALFQSTRYRRDESELVILVTPYLVGPTRDRVATTPLDRPLPPSPPPPIPVKSKAPPPSSGLMFK
jgi:pilus assembly protein CpaC